MICTVSDLGPKWCGVLPDLQSLMGWVLPKKMAASTQLLLVSVDSGSAARHALSSLARDCVNLSLYRTCQKLKG